MKKKQIMHVYIPKKTISETLKGEVILNEIKFPKSLGEEHSFKFETVEGIYKKFGYVTSAVDIHVDFIAGTDFQVKSKNEKAEDIINMWMEDNNFKIILRKWIREALVKGNGFLEIDPKTNEIKILNANNIYIKRNKKGEILGYNQYFGLQNGFDKNNVEPFNENQIIHLPFNEIGDGAYGYGIVYPALAHINYILQNEKDMHMLMSRKANSPLQIKIGTPESPCRPDGTDLEAFGSRLEYLNNLHEWVTDERTEMKVIDFGNFGEKFASVLEHDMDMLIYIFQVPEIYMGKGNITDGLGDVQKGRFERRIKSIQAILERLIEDRLFKPILANNGIKDDIEFIWNLPSEEEILKKVDQIQRLLATISISPQMKAMLELKLAELLGFDDDSLPTPEEAQAQAEQDKLDMQKQLQNPNEKPTTEPKPNKERQKEEAKSQPQVMQHIHEKLEEFNEKPLNEFVNYNYLEFVKTILREIDKDNFENLQAVNKLDIELGLLNEKQIHDLKLILKEGFAKGQNIKQISDNIQKNIDLKDRYIIDDQKNKVLSLSKEERPIIIARTETLRMANKGAIENFRDNGFEKVSWIAAISERTCEECMNLNGQIMELDEFLDKKDEIHPCCRCTCGTVK